MTAGSDRSPIQSTPAVPERCVVALGSNLGDRGETLTAAVRELADVPGVEVVAVSPVYESVALTAEGPDPSAPPYLNGVLILETSLSPLDLLGVLHAIEDRHGRVRVERWGSRTLDLDIVDFGGRRSEDPELTLPHPRAAERSFVLVPWLDVDADARLEGHGPIRELPAASEWMERAGS